MTGTHATYWKTEKGFISVKISTTSRVALTYEDSINSELDEEEKNAKVQNDI